MHYDDAFIEGVRTDLSFTLFLSQPDSYTGGELEIESPLGTQAIKLTPGCALVYPSHHLHAVRPVQSGVRLAIVGWIQSRVPSLDHRQILYDLADATDRVEQTTNVSSDDLIRLKHVRNNLVRLWSEA